ncbi:hypothetical protein ACFQ9X_16900 [Catenulispora yoronensis]
MSLPLAAEPDGMGVVPALPARNLVCGLSSAPERWWVTTEEATGAADCVPPPSTGAAAAAVTAALGGGTGAAGRRQQCDGHQHDQAEATLLHGREYAS